ncbi:MAG: CDP-diacylglycerol--serine O-phosphatidyltransferase [Gemmatimonadales bacterium]|nr:CDP-diacylglycerol--serine O-phosphatidyltransferase [Gemmatimonadales bacterium]
MGLSAKPLRPDMRRVVVVVPSAFTLGNLFFGFWSIVSAVNGKFAMAGWLIVFAGVLDLLDGRVARLSKTESRFGAELDSLVDCVSFGMAPALLMYFLEFRTGGKFAWVLCWLFVVAVALRLARYNVLAQTKPAGSQWFTGMPSPAAGMTLASWYPFSQTEWYRRTLEYLDLERQGLVVLMLLLSLLMVSAVKYPRLPRMDLRSPQGIFGLLINLIIFGGALLAPASFLFPLGLFYLAFGIVRALLHGLLDRPEADAALATGTDGVTPLPLRRRPDAGGSDDA